MKTKQKILNKALELFNREGIEYVGLRELAAIMSTKVGNISGHFAKKDDLVNALALQFSEKNNLLWIKNEIVGLKDFFALLKSHFRQQTEYRFLFISFANLQTHHSEIAERTKKEEKVRKDVIRQSLDAMIKNGELKEISKKEIDFLTNTISLIINSWISEAVISLPKTKAEKQINYFLEIIESLMLLYTNSPKT